MESVPTAEIVPGPVPRSQRIESLDVLRGLALLGILLINIQSFSMIQAAYMNPTAGGDLTGVNYVAWLAAHVLADWSFMTIFAMLLGAGIVLMTARRRDAGRSQAAVHYRRMAVLLLMGLLHAHLLWYGDILYHYALCGLVVYLVRNWRPWSLLIAGGLMMGVASVIWLLSAWSMQFWHPAAIEAFRTAWSPTQEMIAKETAAYRAGWLGQMSYRTLTALTYQTSSFLFAICWRASGSMLLGMALLKLGVFSAKRSSTVYLAMIAVAVCVGVPAILYGVHRKFAAGWELRYSFFIGSQYSYWASLLITLGWIGLVMLVCKHARRPAITGPLAAVGRLALSNYLLQTLICTTLFYGHGFGLFGRVELAGQMAIVLAIWALQLVASPVWLGRFDFGPVEWAWRCLTYMKLLPIRRA